MGSFIDLSAVQSHLVSAGHKMTSQEVAQLLNNLGFLIPKEGTNPPNDVVSPLKPNFIAPTVPSYESVMYNIPDEVHLPPLPRSPDGIASLAAKLDDLEEQLNAINDAQTRVTHEWGTERQNEEEEEEEAEQDVFCGACACCPPTSGTCMMGMLGNGAQQLRDWAQGRWPNLPQCSSDQLGFSNGGRPAERVGSRHSRGRPGGARKALRPPQGSKRPVRTDPVARYR